MSDVANGVSTANTTTNSSASSPSASDSKGPNATFLLPVPNMLSFRFITPNCKDCCAETYHSTLDQCISDALTKLKEELKLKFPDNFTLSDQYAIQRAEYSKVLNQETPQSSSNLTLLSPLSENLVVCSDKLINSENFNWIEFSKAIRDNTMVKYGFMDEYKKAIIMTIESIQTSKLSSQGPLDLSLINNKQLESLLSTHYEYSLLLYDLLGGERGIAFDGEKYELFDGLFHQNTNYCYLEPPNKNYLPIWNQLSCNKNLSKLHYWEEGLGIELLIVEYLIVLRNLTCLQLTKALKIYKTLINTNESDGCQEQQQDSTILAWDQLEDNIKQENLQNKKTALRELSSGKVGFLPRFSIESDWIPKGWINSNKSPRDTMQKQTKYLDIVNKCNTFNHFVWVDNEFISKDELLFDTKLSSNTTFIQTPEITKKLEGLYLPVVNSRKLNLLKELDAYTMKLFHNEKYDNKDKMSYSSTMFTHWPITKEKEVLTNQRKKILSLIIQSFVRSFHSAKKLETITHKITELGVPKSSDSTCSAYVAFDSGVKKREEIAFLLSLQNVILLRVAIEKMTKITQVDSCRYALSSTSSSKMTKWLSYQGFLSFAAQLCPIEHSLVKGGYSNLQMDALRLSPIYTQKNSRVDIPWTLESGRSLSHIDFLNSNDDNKSSIIGDELISVVENGLETLVFEVTNEIKSSFLIEGNLLSKNSIIGTTTIDGWENCKIRKNLPDSSISPDTLWSTLLLTNYVTFLDSYLEMLQRHFFAMHWGAIKDINKNFYVDPAQSEAWLRTMNTVVDTFQKYIFLSSSNNNNGRSMAWRHQESNFGACGPWKSDFEPLREFLDRLKYNAKDGTCISRPENVGNGRFSPFLMLSPEYFLSKKSLSYMTFFQESVLYASSIFSQYCKSQHISSRESSTKPSIFSQPSAGLVKLYTTPFSFETMCNIWLDEIKTGGLLKNQKLKPDSLSFILSQRIKSLNQTIFGKSIGSVESISQNNLLSIPSHLIKHKSQNLLQSPSSSTSLPPPPQQLQKQQNIELSYAQKQSLNLANGIVVDFGKRIYKLLKFLFNQLPLQVKNSGPFSTKPPKILTAKGFVESEKSEIEYVQKQTTFFTNLLCTIIQYYELYGGGLVQLGKDLENPSFFVVTKVPNKNNGYFEASKELIQSLSSWSLLHQVQIFWLERNNTEFYGN